MTTTRMRMPHSLDPGEDRSRQRWRGHWRWGRSRTVTGTATTIWTQRRAPGWARHLAVGYLAGLGEFPDPDKLGSLSPAEVIRAAKEAMAGVDGALTMVERELSAPGRALGTLGAPADDGHPIGTPQRRSAPRRDLTANRSAAVHWAARATRNGGKIPGRSAAPTATTGRET